MHGEKADQGDRVMRPMRALVAATLIVAAGSSAEADPLTFYTDQAAWEAAVAGDNVGAYSGTITRTDYLATYNYNSTGITLASTFTSINTANTISNGAFQPTFFADFSAAGDQADMCLSHACTLFGYASGGGGAGPVVIDFSTPIIGFGATVNFRSPLEFTLNGIPLPNASISSHFLGVTGGFSELSFAGGCAICDLFNLDVLIMNNVVIASTPIPEPGSLLLFILALALLRITPISTTSWIGSKST